MRDNQVGHDEDEIVGTIVERRFFTQIRVFYEANVQKILDKFPFEDPTIKELAFLDPRNRRMSTVTGIIHLATRFCQFSTDEIDMLTIQFQDYRACSDIQLPSSSPKEVIHTIDYFWAAMAELKDVSDHESLRFGVLSQLAKTVLVLPHSNADPERLFSMLRKILTDQRKSLDQATICDYLVPKSTLTFLVMKIAN